MAYFSNGTSGMMYEEEYCSKCEHGPSSVDEACCPVWHAHMMHNYDECNNDASILDILIPMEGCFPKKCTMFIRRIKTAKQIQDDIEQEHRASQYDLWKKWKKKKK